jgi:oligoribonuclease NrnB/cAMP/cGMP phosphodiesterase (DHH superfamily)
MKVLSLTKLEFDHVSQRINRSDVYILADKIIYFAPTSFHGEMPSTYINLLDHHPWGLHVAETAEEIIRELDRRYDR